MTRKSIHSTLPILKLLRCRWPVLIGLCLAFLGAPTPWAQSVPTPSASNEPETGQAYRLGMSLVKAGRLDEAISTFKNGLGTDPQSAVLLNLIGATYSLQGNSEQAEHYLLKSLQADSRFESARRNLAI